MASADREDSGGNPFRPGRFTGRDRASHRRLDVEVVERTHEAKESGLRQRTAAPSLRGRSAVMSANDVSVVLVHGAWADGSSWAKVIAPLAADGFNVVAAPLPLTSLRDDVAALD